MCNTNLTREQLVSILSDAQQLVQNARSALTLITAYAGTKNDAVLGYYGDECKQVHKRVDAIIASTINSVEIEACLKSSQRSHQTGYDWTQQKS